MEQTISCLFTVERRMVMEIREVGDGNAKKEICDTVLHRLPEWFGIEESITGALICRMQGFSARSPFLGSTEGVSIMC